MKMRDFHGKWRDKNEVSFGGGREGKMVFAAVFSFGISRISECRIGTTVKIGIEA